jgi:hypothetical protein
LLSVVFGDGSAALYAAAPPGGGSAQLSHLTFRRWLCSTAAG